MVADTPMQDKTMALWSKEHPGANVLVSEVGLITELLNEKLPTFQNAIQLDRLWVHLRQYKVVDLNDQRRIKSKGAEPDQIHGLIDFLLTSNMFKVHGFFKALEASGQGYIIDNIGLSSKDYKDPEEDEIDLPSVPSHQPEGQEKKKRKAAWPMSTDS